MVANKEITDQFIQNIKSNPNKVHDLTGEMKKSLKKQRLETSIKPQIHKIIRITDNNGKTKYIGGHMQTMNLRYNQVGFVKIVSSVNQNSTSK